MAEDELWVLFPFPDNVTVEIGGPPPAVIIGGKKEDVQWALTNFHRNMHEVAYRAVGERHELVWSPDREVGDERKLWEPGTNRDPGDENDNE